MSDFFAVREFHNPCHHALRRTFISENIVCVCALLVVFPSSFSSANEIFEIAFDEEILFFSSYKRKRISRL